MAHCPTCGSPVQTVSGDEGTNHYQPVGLQDLREWCEEEARAAEHVQGKLEREAEDTDVAYLADAESFRIRAKTYRAVIQHIEEMGK